MSLKRPLDPKALSFHKRRRHFKRKRAYADTFEKNGLPDIAQSLRDCGETEVLACCGHCGKSWYITDHCRLRVCPLCSFKRARKRAEYIEHLTRNMEHPKMLTLTMPRWTEDPGEGIDHLRACWNKLRRHKLFSKVTGGCYNIELKPKEDGWHIHMHVMLDCPYLPYQNIFSAWKAITGIYCPEIDIRSAQGKGPREYLVKDASKSVAYDTNPTDIVRWYEATKNKRLFSTFGKWFNASMEDLDPDALPELDKPACPFCAQTGSVFLARDGPWIYGPDDWQSIQWAYMQDDGLSRPISIAREFIDNPHPELDPVIVRPDRQLELKAS